MDNTCENCKHEQTCHKTIGFMFGFCNIDFEPKPKMSRELIVTYSARGVYDLTYEEMLRLKELLFDGCHENGNLDEDEVRVIAEATAPCDIPDSIVRSAFSGYEFDEDGGFIV